VYTLALPIKHASIDLGLPLIVAYKPIRHVV